MTGSLHIKNSIYYAVLNTYENGKRKQKWINTGLTAKGNKRKAEQLLAQYKAECKQEQELLNNDPRQIPQPLFVDYATQWLTEKKNKIELCTWESYEIYLTRHIVPYFKELDLKLSDVSPKHVKDYYEYKFSKGRLDGKKGGLSAASLKKHSSIIKMIFKDAMLSEVIDRNPAALVPLPRYEPEEPKGVYLTAQEANEVLQLFREHQLQPLLFVTLYYGLRRSEALGLKWSAVNFEENTMRIQHTVVLQKTLVAKDKTKSLRSRRTYQLLPEIREILLTLKEKAEENAKIFGRSYQKSDYIFVWPDGRSFSPHYLTRGFQCVLKKNNFPHMRFHDLRHSTASILYDKGWGLKEIQEWLGHSDIQVTGNIYTHISRQRNANMAKDLENTFHL